MYNYLMLIGRLKEVNDETKQIKVSVQKPFRNANGVIESELFTLNVCDFVMEVVRDNVQIDNIISVKGRIQLNQENSISLIAEKIMFFN